MPNKIRVIRQFFLRVLASSSLLIVLLGFCATVLWAIIYVFVEDACNPFLLLQASEPMRNVVFSCGEFWINRYQGLLGNVLTATVAFITLGWLTQQLTAANRQAAVAAAQGLRQRSPELRDERNKYLAIENEINSLIGADNLLSERPRNPPEIVSAHFVHALLSARSTARMIVTTSDEILGQNPEGRRAGDATKMVAYAIMLQNQLAGWVADSPQEARNLRDRRLLAGEIDQAAADALVIGIRQLFANILAIANQLVRDARAEEIANMIQIRRFEAAAIS